MLKTERKKNKVYNTKNSTDCIHALQDLMNDKSNKFEWTNHLDVKEVRFVYDMVNKGNSFKDFIPTENQNKWMIGVLNKLKLMKETEKNGGIKSKSKIKQNKINKK